MKLKWPFQFKELNRNLLFVVFFLMVGVYLGFRFNEEQVTSIDLPPLTEAKGESRMASLGILDKSAKPKVKGELDVRINDPALKANWGIAMTSSEAAWKKITTGDKKVIVAIIDTGVDTNHPDLRNNLWVNPGEIGTDSRGRNKSTNGIDDDKNDFVDDVHGWNFTQSNNNISDNHGHGTHIAGIVGAEGGNGIGIVGVSPKVSLMIIKYYDPQISGASNLQNTVRAIRYAVKMKANIINYSGGGLEPSIDEKQAIEEAEKKDILFIAAAGNEKSNSDIKGYYPADYHLSNIISVTAVKESDLKLVDSSNYGQNSVDLAAPGKNIYSTLPGNNYNYMTGTSQATAFVTGVAALIKARYPDFSAKRIAEHLKTTGDYDREKLGTKTRHATYLNTYKALATMSDSVSANGAVVKNLPNQSWRGSGRFQVQSEDRTISAESLDSLSDFSRELVKVTEKMQAIRN